MAGKAHLAQCPNGLRFNTASQVCDHADRTDCERCSPFGLQHIAVETSCTDYLECRYGLKSQKQCGPGMRFDKSTGHCNYEHHVACPHFGLPTLPGAPGVAVPPNPPAPGLPGVPVGPPGAFPPTGEPAPTSPDCLANTGQIFHAHASDCRRYYICIRGHLWNQQCPSNLHWNQRENSCDVVANARCIHSVIRPPGGIVPPVNPPIVPPGGVAPGYPPAPPGGIIITPR